MPQTVRGTFEIKLERQPAYDARPGATVGRASGTKQFSGALVATSDLEMIGAMTEVKGSAGYVAMERVVGALDGKRGSFLLQHSSTVTRGAQAQSITVVPDSATEELRGLRGSMRIDIVDGTHHYTFDYELAPQA